MRTIEMQGDYDGRVDLYIPDENLHVGEVVKIEIEDYVEDHSAYARIRFLDHKGNVVYQEDIE